MSLAEAEEKVERLTGLNREMQDLVKEERDFNSEELQRMQTECSLQLKQADSRYVVARNKLT